MRKGVWVLAFVSIALLDCATLDPIDEGVCGNGVVDATEDCDGFASTASATSKCGAPNEGPSACRLKCASAVDCPDGWGCSVTGICREPSGRFGAIGEGVSAGVETMVVGDFDGDRRKDVLASGPRSPNGTAKVRVHYFGEKAALAQVNALSAPISSPTVKDFNKDGVDDFAFGLELGALGVMSGQVDRSLIPAVFPSFRVPRADAKPVLVFRGSRRMPTGGNDVFLFAGRFTTGAGAQVTLLSSVFGENPYAHALPVGPEAILGDPVWAPFFTSDPDSTCGEVAVAMKGVNANGVIQVFSPCRPKLIDKDGIDSAWASARAPVVIDPPLPLDGGIHVFDENNDKKFDILFGVKGENGRTQVYLARSNGMSFDKPIQTALIDLPIASGDLDGDGKVDFVMPSAVAFSNREGIDAGAPDGGAPDAGVPDGSTPFRDYLQGEVPGRRVRWTTARIGNFNGDGLTDFIAASSDQPDIDFFGATSPGSFVRSTISTSGPVTRLTVADLDGDKLLDIGFVQQRPGVSGVTDVTIAYGRANGPPEAPTIIGRTSDVRAMDPLFDPNDPRAALQGLGLVAREPAADGGLPDLTFALIIGNGDRQPVAPLLLSEDVAESRDSDPDIRREWVPLEVHAANFADPNRTDLVALAVGYRVSMSRGTLADGPYPAAVWVAQGKGGTSFDAPTAVQELGVFAVGERRQVAFDAHTTVGDIDHPRNGTADFVVLQKPPGSPDLNLIIAGPQRNEAPLVIPNESVRRDAPMTLVDLDGDGNLDLLVLLGDGNTRKVVAFYNNSRASFIVPGTTVPLPDGEVPAGFTYLATAGAAAHGARNARREIAIVTNRRLVLAAVEDRTKFVLRDVVTEGAASLVAPTAIASGDFDGDGVDDLAIADGSALRILRQLSVK